MTQEFVIGAGDSLFWVIIRDQTSNQSFNHCTDTQCNVSYAYQSWQRTDWDFLFNIYSAEAQGGTKPGMNHSLPLPQKAVRGRMMEIQMKYTCRGWFCWRIWFPMVQSTLHKYVSVYERSFTLAKAEWRLQVSVGRSSSGDQSLPETRVDISSGVWIHMGL